MTAIFFVKNSGSLAMLAAIPLDLRAPCWSFLWPLVEHARALSDR
jgi:hypothetical protein